MLFDITHTPVAETIAHVAKVLDAVAAGNHQAQGPLGDDITPFHSRAVPGISVHEYLERVAKFVYLENDTLLAVLVYLDRVVRAQRHRPALVPSPFNIHRLVITAIVIAHKFSSDVFFNNARYSKVGGIPLAEMNQLELEMLFLIKFDLKVDTAELQSIGEWLVGRPPVLAGHWAPLELFAPHTDYAARLQQQMQQQQQLPTPDFAPTPDRLQGVVSPLELARCASHRRKPSSRDLRRQKQCRAPAPDAVLATPCSIDTGSPSCEIHHSCVASSACSEMHGPVSPPGLLDGAQGAQRHRRRRTSGMHAAPPAAVNIGFTADADRRHA